MRLTNPLALVVAGPVADAEAVLPGRRVLAVEGAVRGVAADVEGPLGTGGGREGGFAGARGEFCIDEVGGRCRHGGGGGGGEGEGKDVAEAGHLEI